MSGISQPDRQAECLGCKRILTLGAPERTNETEIACPSCPGVAVLPPLDNQTMSEKWEGVSQ